MLSAGKRIMDATDKLVSIGKDYLYNSIKSPTSTVEAQLRNLRLVYSLDKNRYNQLKRELPYVVCGTFNPPFRKIENFASIDCFVIDLDHLSEHNYNAGELKSALCKDSRIEMCFISPSGNGLKLLFKLKEKCYDPGEFSAFYKVFVGRFASENNIEDIIDGRTCDVSRACFISSDNDIYYNKDAETIDLKQVLASLGETRLPIDEKKDETPIIVKEEKTNKDVKNPNDKLIDPDDDIMLRIKQQLNLLRSREKVEQHFYVPSEIEMVMTGVRSLLSDTGVTISQERDIQYGKQLVLTSQLRKAELNIFFGRRGFSVVELPRRGTSPQLNNLLGELVREYLNSLNN